MVPVPEWKFWMDDGEMSRAPAGRMQNLFKNNRNIALISHAYAMDNPRHWTGYGDDAWGQSAGVNNGGGRAQPRDDNGTIIVHAALLGEVDDAVGAFGADRQCDGAHRMSVDDDDVI